MAGRLSWFLTSTGKTFSFGCMSTASIVAFGVQYFPHTFLLHKYKEVVSMYESAVPVPLSERVQKCWNDTLTDLSLPEHEVRYLEPFTVFGFDLFRAGSIGSRYGAIIGIPVNFTYTDVASVHTAPIRVNNEPVNWNRQDAKQLLDALVLSDDAQRYGIAREVLMARHNEALTFSLLGTFMVASTYVLCRGMNNRFTLLERPLPFRAFFYFVGCVIGYGVWATQKDMLNIMWEQDADKYLAQLDSRYSKGAVEFYGKMLKRNMALRTLLGSEGESVYTSTGNERHLFRQPRIPIDARKSFFESNLAEGKRGQELLNEEEAVPAPA